MQLENKQLGAYQLRTLIGQGRMAQVWLANHTALNRQVAVKVIADSSENPIIERFRRETSVIAGLEHPNILPVIDYDSADGWFYLVQPYVPGGSLQEQLQQQPLTRQQAFDLFEQVLNGLAFAHAKGVIHRDLKPGNILLYVGGRAVISDFGLANILNMNEDIELTMTGKIIGSPEYMAPEQFLGQDEPASDLYSLAVILYQLLSGKLLYEGHTAWELGMRHLNDLLPLPNPLIPAYFEKFFAKALHKRPAGRFASAEEMLVAFRQAAKRMSAAELAAYPQTEAVKVEGQQEQAQPVEIKQQVMSTLVRPLAMAAVGSKVEGVAAPAAPKFVEIYNGATIHNLPALAPISPEPYRPMVESVAQPAFNTATARFEPVPALKTRRKAKVKTKRARPNLGRAFLYGTLAAGWVVAALLTIMLVMLLV